MNFDYCVANYFNKKKKKKTFSNPLVPNTGWKNRKIRPTRTIARRWRGFPPAISTESRKGPR